MSTEHEIARGIQRQKIAQGRANFASGAGCIGTAIALCIVLGLIGSGLWIVAPIMVISLVVGGVIYRRVLGRNLGS